MSGVFYRLPPSSHIEPGGGDDKIIKIDEIKSLFLLC